MPRYELIEGTSRKFWEITLAGTSFTTRYGRIGSEGQSTTKAFASEALARKEHDKLIAEKTRKGYVLVGGAAPAPPGDAALEAALRRLDPLLAEHSDAKLGAPATEAALAALAERISGGRPLPADVVTFFRWHDGQENAKSLSPDDRWTLLATGDVLEVFDMLREPTWVPLFENGAGDFLVLETAGPGAGSLVSYWHTEKVKARKVEHASLLAWAKTLAERLTPEESPKKKSAEKPAKKSAKADRIRLELGAPSWTRLEKSPTPRQAAAMPVGTIYSFKQLLFGHAEPWCHVFVKVAPDVWLKDTGRPGPEDAIARLQKKIEQRRPPADWEWRKDDKSLAIVELNAKKVKTDGAAPHVGLSVAQIQVHGTVVPHRDGL